MYITYYSFFHSDNILSHSKRLLEFITFNFLAWANTLDILYTGVGGRKELDNAGNKL